VQGQEASQHDPSPQIIDTWECNGDMCTLQSYSSTTDLASSSSSANLSAHHVAQGETPLDLLSPPKVK
jgi:hypothetical protein